MVDALDQYCPNPPQPLQRPAWLAAAAGSSWEDRWTGPEEMAFRFHFALQWVMDAQHGREQILAGAMEPL
eukprot:4646483-Alexandrium_andersonii.AAC.1